MISLITCTGDRPEAFAMCEKYMARQTYKDPVEWVVIDDGESPTRPTKGQIYQRYKPSSTPRESFRANYLRALKAARGDIILFIEDDDWYTPAYIASMVHELRDLDMYGEGLAKFYHVPTAQYRVFQNYQNASLCQTGMRRSMAALANLILQTTDKPERLDGFLWKNAGGVNKRIRWKSTVCVGIKGMPGRKGLGHSHDYRDLPGYHRDPRFSQLAKWIGSEDARAYQEIHKRMNEGK